MTGVGGELGEMGYSSKVLSGYVSPVPPNLDPPLEGFGIASNTLC